jgi:anti-sigma B factor antagonist
MRIDTRIHHDIVIIQPNERITVETDAQFTAMIRTLLEAGSRRLVLNLVDVPYIDSDGLAAIVQAYTATRRRGGDLKLLHLRDRTRQLLAVTRLLTVLEAYDTEDEVARSFNANSEASLSTPAECC